MHLYVYSTDIQKMYRQIIVHPDDGKYQQILWCSDSSVPLKLYNLNTVTYGIAPSAFLALRTLRQLASDEGPINIRTTPGRGHKSMKGYIVVFVCMCTKAVHLEAVSSYDAKHFIAAFNRFISRRGLCRHVYSDCGTNFVGANRYLRSIFAQNSDGIKKIIPQLSDKGIEWHFNPPAAPHFGGLWEAAVRSMKHHLKRVIGETTLTFEELSTLLTTIEACLNSRPISPISDDPTDLRALTPAHLIIGR